MINILFSHLRAINFNVALNAKQLANPIQRPRLAPLLDYELARKEYERSNERKRSAYARE